MEVDDPEATKAPVHPPVCVTDLILLPQDPNFLFYDNSKRPACEYEIFKRLRTEGQAVEVVVVRRNKQLRRESQADSQATCRYLRRKRCNTSSARLIFLAMLRRGEIWASRDIYKENTVYSGRLNTHIFLRLSDFEINSTPTEGIKAYLYTPYCPHGDLGPYVGAGPLWETKPTLSTSQFWQIFRQLSSALLYCQYGIST